MKKVLGLFLALVMVLSIATVGFAAEAEEPIVLVDNETIEITDGDPMSGGFLYEYRPEQDGTLKIIVMAEDLESPVYLLDEYGDTQTGELTADENSLVYTTELTVPMRPGGYEFIIFGGKSDNTGKITYTVTFTPGEIGSGGDPAGTDPVVVVDNETINVTNGDLSDYSSGYLIEYTAEADGTLKIIAIAADNETPILMINHESETISGEGPDLIYTLDVTAAMGDYGFTLYGGKADHTGEITYSVIFTPGTSGSEEGSGSDPITVYENETGHVDNGDPDTGGLEINYTAPADGTLSITVTAEDTDTEVSFSYNKSWYFGSVSNPATATEDFTVSAGDVCTFLLYGGKSDHTGNVTYTLIFTPGEVEGEAPLGSEENPEILWEGLPTPVELEEGNEGYVFRWTATGNGLITIAISSEAPWMYWVSNTTSGAESGPHTYTDDPQCTSVTMAVAAGDVIDISVGTLSDPETPNPAGTITVTLTVNDPYKLDPDTVLTLGTNELTPLVLPGVDTTVYAFTPEQDGIYHFEAPEGILLGYYGGDAYFLFDNTTDKTNTLDHTVAMAGQTVYVGVQSGSPCSLTITRTGDRPKTAADFDWVFPRATQRIFSGDALEGKWSWVNVRDDVKDTAVLGSDGYYHLNSADGPVLFMDLSDHRYVDLIDANQQRGGSLRYTLQTGEETWEKVNYRDLFNDYRDLDENGEAHNTIVALTEELMIMLQRVGSDSDWYGEYGWVGGEAEEAWMFPCKYLADYTSVPAADEGTNPPSGDETPLLLLSVLLLGSAVAMTVSRKKFHF